MAGSLATAYIDIKPNTKGFKGAIAKDVGGAGKPASKGFRAAFLPGLKSVGIAGGVALGAGIAVGIKGAVSEASDLQETKDRLADVFGGDTEVVDSLLERINELPAGLVLSDTAAAQAIGTYARYGKSAGLAGDAAEEFGIKMTGLAADIASAENISLDEANQRISSGLAGETEPLRRLGINVSAKEVEAEGKKLGLAADGALSEAEKIQARASLIEKQATELGISGNLERTAGSLANQGKALSATFDDLQATVGEKLTPVLASAAAGLNEFLNSEGFQSGAAAVGDAIGNIGASLGEFFSNESVQQSLQSIGSAFVELGSALGTILGSGAFQFLASGALEGIAFAFESLANAVRLVAAILTGDFGAAADAFKDQLQNIGDFLGGSIERIGTVLGLIGPAIRAAFGGPATAAINKFRNAWNQLKNLIGNATNSITNRVRSMASAVGNAVTSAGSRVVSGFRSAWEQARSLVSSAVSGIQGIVRRIPGIIGGVIGQAASQARNLGQKIVSSVISGLAALASRMQSTLNSAVSNAIAGAAAIASGLARIIGSNIVNGVLSGLAGLAGKIRSKVQSAVSSALSNIDVPGFSPVESAGRKAIGLPIVEGALRGLDELQPRLTRGLSKAIRDSINEAKSNVASLAQSLGQILGQALDFQAGDGSPFSARIGQLEAAQQAEQLQDLEEQLQRSLDRRARLQERATELRAQGRVDQAVNLEERAAEEGIDEELKLLKFKQQSAAKEISLRKEVAQRQIDDLSIAFNKGVISQADYLNRVKGILAAEGVNYQNLGANLGLRFAEGFRQNLNDLRNQIRQVSIGPRGLGAGLSRNEIVSPTRALQADRRERLDALRQQLESSKEKARQDGRITKTEGKRLKAIADEIKELTKNPPRTLVQENTITVEDSNQAVSELIDLLETAGARIVF